MKILLRIAFLGTKYCGYQIQPNGPTIQQCLNEAAQKLFGYPCDIVGCSRTDSGVHANDFCVTVAEKGKNTLETTVPIARLPQAMSCFLPDDISVLTAEWVAEEFHPRYDVAYKEYVYRIWNEPHRNPFWLDRAWHCPRKIDDGALARMNEAAAGWIGTYDFASYMAAGSKITDTVRTVYEACVVRESESMLCFRIRANGFLYHMVRILAGTLIDVANGKLTPEDVRAITEARNRTRAGQTAPACGLYLNRVIY